MEEYKFGIIGIGPTGGIMAAHLAHAGHELVLVDKLKDHTDEIKKNGLTITHLKELNVKFLPENLCYSIEELQNKEVNTLFIAVKASYLKYILPQIKKVVNPGTTLISLQNGFDDGVAGVLLQKEIDKAWPCNFRFRQQIRRWQCANNFNGDIAWFFLTGFG